MSIIIDFFSNALFSKSIFALVTRVAVEPPSNKFQLKLRPPERPVLVDTATKEAAFAGESQANRRYLYFAQKADIEGYNDVASVFRSTAEGETGHAHGHLEYLEEVGDPATGLPIGETKANLESAVQGETHEYTDMYPGMAKTAREEGFEEIADWFETLAKAEKSHAGKFQKTLESIS